MTDSPAALRRSLESRFKNASRATGQPSPPQIRRRFGPSLLRWADIKFTRSPWTR